MTHPAAHLEQRLLDPAVRVDPAALDELLHPEFVEVGVSGRVWGRADLIAALVADPQCPVDITDLHVTEPTHGIAMVTYELAGVLRMSLWVRDLSRWRLRYHQGTRSAVDA